MDPRVQDDPDPLTRKSGLGDPSYDVIQDLASVRRFYFVRQKSFSVRVKVWLDVGQSGRRGRSGRG